MSRTSTPAPNSTNNATKQRPVSLFLSAQPKGDRGFYGVDKVRMVSGWPTTSPAHDPAYYYNVNSGGLAAAWRFWSERFTVVGRWFLVACGTLFIAGVNSLDLQAYIPLLYAVCFWIAALLVSLRSRPRAGLQILHADRVCAGETLPVEIEAVNRGKRSGHEWRVLPHRLPPQIGIIPENGAPFAPIAPNEAARSQLGLVCQRRGVYMLRGWRVETSYPFGLINTSQLRAVPKRLLVFPAFTPLLQLDIPTGRRHHPGGVALASHLGDSFEFLGNREYREGDNPRDIDWRATGRLQKPIVREYREEYFLRVAVVLDTHIPKLNNAVARDDFERAVSLCAAVGDFMARQEYLVDIFAAGPNLYHLMAGRSLAYLDQILDILACVDPNLEDPFAVLEPEILENLAQINAIVCVFMDWDDTRRTFCRRLAQSGAGLKVIITRDSTPTEDPMADTDWLGLIPIIKREQFEVGVTRL